MSDKTHASGDIEPVASTGIAQRHADPQTGEIEDLKLPVHMHVGKDVDVAAAFLSQLDPSIMETPIAEEEARKVLRKIDWTILPLLTASVIIAAVDKVVISNAAIYGMMDDTHLTTSEYSWVGR